MTNLAETSKGNYGSKKCCFGCCCCCCGGGGGGGGGGGDGDGGNEYRLVCIILSTLGHSSV
jgi:hypothetical protein